MQLLLVTFLFVCASAELRVSKRSTFTGQESSHPVPHPADGASARHLQDCEVIGWVELCERKKLTARACFQLEPTAEAPLCELQGPHGAPAQLRPATAGILTLRSGELRITGQIQMTSLRLAAKTVNFADAHVEAWHEGPSDPNATALGGAFFSEGSFTLTRSRLTVRGSAAADGGGFAAGGDLSVFQDSEVVIENVSAKSGAGFVVMGDAYIFDNSMIFIQNARSTKNGGGFSTRKRLQVSNSSVISLQNVTAQNHGGGFHALGEVEIAGNSTVSISDSQAESGDGAGFSTEKGLKLSTGSRLLIWNATAGNYGGGFYAKGKTLINSSSVSIRHTTAKHYGGGFMALDEVAIDEMSNVRISNSKSAEQGGGFQCNRRLQVTNGSVVSLENVTAGSHAGGFTSLGQVEIAGNSTVNISSSHAESGDGGAFRTEKGLKVSTSSRLIIRNAAAGKSGGGFYAKGRVVISSSTVSIQDATASRYGGGFDAREEVVIDEMSSVSISNSISGWGGGCHTDGRLQVTNSSVLSLQNVTAQNYGGGFNALGKVEIAGNSTVNISNSHVESGNGGGFDTEMGLMVSMGSRLIIRNATAGKHGGGFFVDGRILISRSTLNIQQASARRYGGGFDALDEVVIDGMSTVLISHSRAAEQGGGFQTEGRLQVTNSSVLSLQTVSARGSGGGFLALGETVIAGKSVVNISNSHAELGDGGGFDTEKGLKLSTGSRLIIRKSAAGRHGGGFYATAKGIVISRSTVSIQDATASRYGGGFYAFGEVVIDEMSSVRMSNSISGWGGGCHTDGRLQVTNGSLLSLQNVTAQHHGGFDAEKDLKLFNDSRLMIRKATAGQSGGGFYVKGRILISSSTVGIQDATARQSGGGFTAEGVEVVQNSIVASFSTHAGAGGGAFSVFGLTLHRSSMSISNSTALGSGSSARADGQVLLLSQSNLMVKDAQGQENSSVLAASCLHLRDRSQVLFDGLVGGHGVELQNNGSSALCSNSTFHVAEDAALNASGRLSSGFLSLAACPKEKVRLSGIHLRSWSSALLSTRPSSVVVDQVSVEYKPPVNNLQVLAAKDGFEIDSLTVSCQNCTWGVTFNASKDRSLKAVSSEHLQCPKTVTASKGLAQRCKCSNYQTVTEHFRNVDLVPLESSFQTCMFCKPHFHFQNGDCPKCGIFSAWSDGKKDVCHVLPRQNSAELFALLTGAAVVVILTFLAFEILHAPLMIVDAKSDLDPTQTERKRIFTISVQGSIVDLPKSLSRLVTQRMHFRVRGTGLIWLDYDQKKSNTIKVRSIARRKLLLQDTSPPFDCASCKGSLHASDFAYLLTLLTACIFVGAMLPVIIKVAVISENGVGHVFVTAFYVTLPLVAVAALLHFPVAWLIQRLYRRTLFSEALDDYRKQINCKPFTGPDATHPRNQGLQVLNLRGLWKHFESFILERNMHFVVANIVRPLTALTQSKGVSFVSLWGGRRVDYFVSHSWGASFPHFVHSIQCHALSKEGPTSWMDAAYWICSFANNQWTFKIELGSDPMESAFALALTAGIKGVAMVLDQEVQPLTRVWCLFEFFLSSREHLELVFVTNAGVVGDDGCSSFDIALEVGKKIESLQVETCEASSEDDKKDILQYIISELGSLERMDAQIRALMAEMLMRNLTNVERATGSLVDRLGQGSATVVALNEERFESHVASGTPWLVRADPQLAANEFASHGMLKNRPVTMIQLDCAPRHQVPKPRPQRCTKEWPKTPPQVSLDLKNHGEIVEWAAYLCGIKTAGKKDCEVIGWAELCERKKLTAGCFQLQPTAEAPLCELQGPHGAPAQLRPATAGILTLTSGELRITGTVNFADAHVEAWHEAPSDPNSTSGGAFFSEGSFTLTRSRLTVRDVPATTMDGGGFAADGDLTLGGIAGAQV
ncbi:unnamed protein product [Cladocopium goreaui]|uniref:Outer membrane protein PmpB n=1 Tax=Cladocopium goreaui TaxID=2562237 RepID=A0A9P1D5I3_9DINO|nr:unnamed protein product [Cladocopium goreaui]